MFVCARFCFNVGRAHKSNGTAWHVDVTVGVMFQTCFDHQCAGFRSVPLPVPEDVLASVAAVSSVQS